jgi:LacI family transcriptional regulator
MARTKPPSSLYRVAVLVDTSTSWGRLIATSIHRYTRSHQPWQLFIEARGTEEHPCVPADWHGDGVIARIGTPGMARQLRALRVPVVNVSGIRLPGVDFPRVNNDLPAGARMAAEYFRDRGFRHFAYFSLLGLPYVVTQQEAFCSAAREAGGDYAVYGVKTHEGAEPDWNLNTRKLVSWLKSLPKPVGILTWNADSGRQIIYACQQAELRIPEEVALLSGTDDDLLCELSHIPISAVRVASEQIGLQAAALLDRLMRGGKTPAQPILIPPLGIVTRLSTDTLAISDPALAKAISFIREKLAHTIRVRDVARHAGLSRRLLERRFEATLGRTPGDEIRRVRLERARQLLETTDLPIDHVAEASGFGSPEYLAGVFRSALLTTPLRYRRQVRCR